MKTNPYSITGENCVEHFGFELRMALRARKLSCAELADSLGKSRSTVRKWLYMSEPTLDHMRLLMPILGISFFQKLMPWMNSSTLVNSTPLPFQVHEKGQPAKEKEQIQHLETRIQELERSLEIVVKSALSRA
jgi:transcriptional regulator with XRE-family HTH domain